MFQIAQFTNMYSLAQTGTNMATTPGEINKFLAINMIMGVIQYPRLPMYWQTGYALELVQSNMSRDRFMSLRSNVHVTDTSVPPADHTSNKLWRVQPLINKIRSTCLRLPRDHKTYSVDEQMIPFLGRCPAKQYVKNKPRPVGLKNFVLTTSSGLVLDFEIYQGVGTRLIDKHLGLGPSVVMRLTETIPASSHIFCDRYFTTIPLLDRLREKGLHGTGTIMANRIGEVRCMKTKERLARGESLEYVRSDDKIVITEWEDSNRVLMASTSIGRNPINTVERWSKPERRYIDVTCPSSIARYNQCMGGVDTCDQMIELYRVWFKTRKWTLKCFLHFLDLAVVNSWFLYKRNAISNDLSRREMMDLLAFKLKLAEALFTCPVRSRRVLVDSSEDEASPVKRSKFYNPPARMPGDDKRYDGYEHWPLVDMIQQPRACRFEHCNSRSKTKCEKCGVYLCLSKEKNCFKLFHTIRL